MHSCAKMFACGWVMCETDSRNCPCPAIAWAWSMHDNDTITGRNISNCLWMKYIKLLIVENSLTFTIVCSS